jgi:hypothetical protein
VECLLRLHLLTSVTIPGNVTYIDYGTFSGCSSLTAISVNPANPNYASDNGVLLNKTRTTLIQCPGGYSGPYNIPDSVTSIGNGAFEGCISLTSVTIPDTVTAIGDGAFPAAPPSPPSPSATASPSIGDYAFHGCTSLTSVTIPESVTNIGDGASLVHLTHIRHHPDSVTSIGSYAFEGCTSLTAISVLPENQHYASDNGVLLNKNRTTLIQCPGATPAHTPSPTPSPPSATTTFATAPPSPPSHPQQRHRHRRRSLLRLLLPHRDQRQSRKPELRK